MIFPRRLLLAVFSLGLACTSASKESVEVPSAPSLSVVDETRTDLLFRFEREGTVETADRIADVPEAARGSVQVLDLSLTPEQRSSTRIVQLFDLRQKGSDGRYSGRLVERAELESALRATSSTAPQAPVTIYTAAWCGVCTKAKAFMREQGIAFVEKDIEKDQAAAADIARRAQAAGVSASGVPIFDVGGRILGGFDPGALTAALKQAGPR
ncbi:MAG: hypothetical protein EXR76_11280 [Myxococcales bacterium]|nr:hypothetical protein [Myxococcales bacterium]